MWQEVLKPEENDSNTRSTQKQLRNSSRDPIARLHLQKKKKIKLEKETTKSFEGEITEQTTRRVV